jgi:ATP-dependent DNA helicase RecG
MDLDLSVIDEAPPGRKEIKTYILPPVQRERAYNLISKQVNNKKQAFIIYPLVEESENSETRAAVEEYERLKMEIFPQHKLGLLHGRMKQEEKDEIMAGFRAREFDILVSTSVIEVGVDIPNATVMLIEGANHFGLAQLHQLRGRVGRGSDLSYCILIPDHSNEIENQRLLVMTTTSNGFELAERDLQQRGPGQFFGTLQSGYLKLRFSNLTDINLVENARSNALKLMETDANLTKPEHHALSAELAKFWTNIESEFS